MKSPRHKKPGAFLCRLRDTGKGPHSPSPKLSSEKATDRTRAATCSLCRDVSHTVPGSFSRSTTNLCSAPSFSVPNVNTSVCCITERAQKPGKKMLHCPKIRAMQGAAGLYQANRAPDHLPGQKKSGIGNAGRRNTSGTPYATSKCYRNSPAVFKERP